jgi:hypothetical protein
MSWHTRRAAQAPVSITERWRQAHASGEVVLDSFTQAELDCVALDPDFLPARQRGPALQTVAPLLARLAAGQRRGDSAPDPAEGGATAAELAAAAASLESRGYLRPGEPRRSDGQLSDELAGWAADPSAPPGSAATRRVAITGDLGMITRMRSQPYWVAEGYISAEPDRADPAASPWRLLGRMYAAYRPPGVLVEQPSGQDGSLPLFAALWQPSAARLVGAWCGIDPAELGDPARRGQVESGGEIPSAAAAAEFLNVNSVRVVHPTGERVVIRSLITASADNRHWLLLGDQAERAVPASIDQIGQRIDELVTPPGGAEGPAAP